MVLRVFFKLVAFVFRGFLLGMDYALHFRRTQNKINFIRRQPIPIKYSWWSVLDSITNLSFYKKRGVSLREMRHIKKMGEETHTSNNCSIHLTWVQLLCSFIMSLDCVSRLTGAKLLCSSILLIDSLVHLTWHPTASFVQLDTQLLYSSI